MRIRIISFTARGCELGEKLRDGLTGHQAEIIYKGRKPLESESAADFSCSMKLEDLVREAFESRIPLVFIGAMGIAVRSIAPFVHDKLTDPPVVVIDERAVHVIPVLSGHMGGANDLALEISSITGADPVITTATDVSNAFSVDLLARENGLRVVNREGIARVSSKALDGKTVTISIRDYPPQEPVDVIITDEDTDVLRSLADIRLAPRRYVLGIGCKRGKDPAEIREYALKIMNESGIDPADVGAVATIDVKKDEEGIIMLSQYLRAPLITFEAAVLERAEGDFVSSEFVRSTVGVDNVSERSAVLAAGRGARLAVTRKAHNGITIAIAERNHG